jgi:hypothetical protein
MCSELFDDREIQPQLETAFKKKSATAAEFLAPVLATNLALAYPVAALIAALII